MPRVRRASPAYLSKLENDAVKKPSPHVLQQLSEALAVPYAELMRLSGYRVRGERGQRPGNGRRSAIRRSDGRRAAGGAWSTSRGIAPDGDRGAVMGAGRRARQPCRPCRRTFVLGFWVVASSSGSAWSTPFRTDRALCSSCSGSVGGPHDHRYHQEGRRRPRLRLHHRRGRKEYFFHRGGLDSSLDFDRLASAASESSSRSSRAPKARGRTAIRLASWARRTGGPTPARQVRVRHQSAPVSLGHRRGPFATPRRSSGAHSTTPTRSHAIVRTAFVSTYPPRHCGIAAFTSDLAANTSNREVVALHLPEQPTSTYPIEVHHRIRRDEPDDYLRTRRGPEQVRRRRFNPARVRDLGRR